MPDSLLAAVQFGAYISIIKFAFFLVLFFIWLALLGWVHDDAASVGLNERLWTAILLAIGAVGLFVWLLIPIFIVGLILCLVAISATSISYAMQRDAHVPEFERILTIEHIKTMFTDPHKKLETLQDLGFITSNGNEIPLPEPKTSEFFSYKAAHDLFKDAISRRTSDITLTPTSQGYSLNYVVDGATLKQPNIRQDQVENLSNLLKQLANLDLEEKRKPQKGHFRIRQEKGASKWEIRTAGSTAGEQIAIRQIMQETISKLPEINLLPEQFEQLNSIRNLKKGLFIISGPPNSGVTTTFYALIRNHDAFINSISTLEYKPSGQLPNVTQEIYSLSDSGTVTYGKKLLSIIRMQPNVLGAVDIKDPETARIACQAAKEGVIVYVTMQADTVVNAVAKWLKLVGDKNLAISTLIGASNQRLFRRLCEQCKQAYEPNRELLRKFNIPPEKVKALYRAGKVVYDKRGKPYPCENCHEIGFFERTCAFETIVLNDQLKKALAQAKSTQDISTLFRRAKMRYLQEQMLERVLDGTTSINEMIRVFSGKKQTRQKPGA
ncbi:MAG: ATPase, T2SS/T4P/T4SS family [Phycisphaerales bacterium]|jgi:type II secretory ATPase GspE/PulE/Tfp pilus assembly ATPase PilB-like protein